MSVYECDDEFELLPLAEALDDERLRVREHQFRPVFRKFAVGECVNGASIEQITPSRA